MIQVKFVNTVKALEQGSGYLLLVFSADRQNVIFISSISRCYRFKENKFLLLVFI